ncbi:MAG: hypothetical protein DRH08_07335 [Deltaproteobacteria bacterium]|nr:MAG: hypothetical protein DRH08_07335 [Deltaproteobacteria bacterium]
MPCYEPPPPWEGDAKRSSEEATRILCSQVKAQLSRGERPSDELLEWFAGHREIDARIAAWTGSQYPSASIRCEQVVARLQATWARELLSSGGQPDASQWAPKPKQSMEPEETSPPAEPTS